MRIAFLSLMFVFAASNINAAVQTFDVDLFGVDPGTGHESRVVGTITLDPTLPAGSAIQSSLLEYQHEDDTPVSFSSLPNVSYGDDDFLGLEWNLVGNDLYITRVSNDDHFFSWTEEDIFSQGTAFLSFGSGAFDHVMGLANAAPHLGVIQIGTEAVVLKPSSASDTGFLVGTAAVPEPAAVWGLAAIILTRCFSRHRSRSKLNSRSESTC